MLIDLIKYGLFFLNITLLLIVVRYYNKHHKLSSTLLIIVLLSLLFQNLEFILHSKETKTALNQASGISKVLFSFSFLIAIIQAGTLSVKNMYLPIVRRSAWFLSFLMLFLGFFVLQMNSLPSFLLKYQAYLIEMLTVLLILIIGIISIISKKQYLLFLGASSYFIIVIIGSNILNLRFLFAIAQLFFVSFLILNEKKSIIKSKTRLLNKFF